MVSDVAPGGVPGPTVTGAWHALAGSVIGSNHVTNGRPNQDAVAATGVGPVAAAAVADGHGSRRCPRSATGARLAATLAVHALRDACASTTGVEELERELRRASEILVQEWRRAVLDDAAGHAFDADEVELLGRSDGALDEAATVLAYGTTLVALCAGGARLGVLQIGDGDVFAVTEDGTSLRLLPDDPRNVANVTSSLAQIDPLRSVRLGVVDLREQPITVALACTDGFGGAFVDRDWWRQVGADLADRVRRFPPEEIDRRIPDWLAEPAEIGGDDASLALLLAGSDSIDERSVPAPDPTTAQPSGGLETRSRRISLSRSLPVRRRPEGELDGD